MTHDADRARRVAFAITSAFEGGSYAAYNNYDAGIVSYGRFQFTLASGSLYTVLARYLDTMPDHLDAVELQVIYRQPIQRRDQALRDDARLRYLLRAVARDPAMQKAQDDVATDLYWNRVQDFTIRPRNLRTVLGQALCFDMAINHGLNHTHLRAAEALMDVPFKGAYPHNGVTEQNLLAVVAEERRAFMYRFADAHKLPGLKPRGDFWVRRVEQAMETGDWNLSFETLAIKPGVVIKVA